MAEYTALVARSLFYAASRDRDAGISTSDLYQEAHVTFTSAGRAGLAFVLVSGTLAVIATALSASSLLLAKESTGQSHKRQTRSSQAVWSAATFLSSLLYCGSATLFLTYGHLASQISVTQGLQAAAFLTAWLAACHALLSRTRDIPLLDEQEDSNALARPLLPKSLRLALSYLLPLPVFVTLVCFLGRADTAASTLSATLHALLKVFQSSSMPTEHARLGTADYDTMASQVMAALEMSMRKTSKLAAGRAVAALMLAPIALVLETLAWRRLRAFIVYARNIEISATNRTRALPRLLRLPSLHNSECSFYAPSPRTPLPVSPATMGSPRVNWWPDDVPLLRNGLMTPRTEAELPRLPASALLRAATLRNAANALSKPLSVAALTPLPDRLPLPRRTGLRRAPSMRSIPTESVYTALPLLPPVAALETLRRKRLYTTAVVCVALLFYAGMELLASLSPGNAIVLPLLTATTALACVQIYTLAMERWEKMAKEGAEEEEQQVVEEEKKWLAL